MLQSKQRTPEEIDAYLEELKTWLKEDRDTPCGGDDGLFFQTPGNL